MRQLSPSGVSLIKQREGERRNPATGNHVAYQDEAGLWTIGWGHLIKAGEPYYPQGSVSEIDDAEAESLVQQDTADAQQAVRDYVTAQITQSQFDALTSLAFNIGRDNFAGSSVVRLLNAGDVQGAANAFKLWNKITDRNTGSLVVSAGLVNRRAQEAQLFLTA